MFIFMLSIQCNISTDYIIHSNIERFRFNHPENINKISPSQINQLIYMLKLFRNESEATLISDNYHLSFLKYEFVFKHIISPTLYNLIQYSNMSKPRESLVQYQPAFETILTESKVEEKRNFSNYDSRLAIDELLSSMFPAVQWDAEGKHFTQTISTNPPSREDVNTLQKLLDEKLVIRQARDSGICPIRQELHRQCYDEIIRQVTIDCPERGVILMRVRDQLYMTISAYETLYESSLTFAMRKQLQAEQGTPQLNTSILQLEEKKSSLQEKAEELKKKKETLQKQIKQKKLTEDKKKAEEIDFLKYQANHLQNFLRSVNEANK